MRAAPVSRRGAALLCLALFLCLGMAPSEGEPVADPSAAAEIELPAIDPTNGMIVYGGRGPRDHIGWSPIAKSDFRSKDPPAHLASHADLIGAVSCLSIQLSRSSSVSVASHNPPVGETRYEVTLAAPRFRAVFDRLCSWWNPRSNFPKYLLQHEQIHFDLTEIAALELGRRLSDAQLVARASSEDEAMEKLAMQIEIHTRQALVDLHERQAHFDAETSVQRSWEDQRRWAAEVSSELEALGASPVAPPVAE